MTTPVAKTLRPLPKRVSVSPVIKRARAKNLSSHPRMPNAQSSTRLLLQQITITPTMKELMPPTKDNTQAVYWREYPPESPSVSFIYSEWLLNHPGMRSTVEPLSVELVRNLDHRFD